MEQELKDNLRRCAEGYAAARGLALPTIGRMAAGDWRFFDRLDNDAKSFTARKYDQVMGWFSDNWPPDTDWPRGLPRPQPEGVAS